MNTENDEQDQLTKIIREFISKTKPSNPNVRKGKEDVKVA